MLGATLALPRLYRPCRVRPVSRPVSVCHLLLGGAVIVSRTFSELCEPWGGLGDPGSPSQSPWKMLTGAFDLGRRGTSAPPQPCSTAGTGRGDRQGTFRKLTPRGPPSRQESSRHAHRRTGVLPPPYSALSLPGPPPTCPQLLRFSPFPPARRLHWPLPAPGPLHKSC